MKNISISIILLIFLFGCSSTDQEKVKEKKTQNRSQNEEFLPKMSREIINGVRLGASQKEWEDNTPFSDQVTKLKWKGEELELNIFLWGDSENLDSDQISELSLNNITGDGRIKENPISLKTITEIYSQKYQIIPKNSDIYELHNNLIKAYKESIRIDESSNDSYSEFISSEDIFFYNPNEDILIEIRGIKKEYYGYPVVSISYQWRADWFRKIRKRILLNENSNRLLEEEKRQNEYDRIGNF